jgi:nitrite reductase/ring-hydroxylating ferredoxin subunit
MPWEYAIDEAALPVGQNTKLMLGGQPIMLSHLDDGFHAVHDTCLHRGASLSVAPLEGRSVSCHLHFWTFDASDGHCTQVPSLSLRVFPTKTEEGKVYVEV